MADKPFAHVRRLSYEKPYNPKPLVNRLRTFSRNKMRASGKAALKSGLDHQAVRRVLGGQRPSFATCILLADHFGINPNEFLGLASLPKLKAFEVNTASAAGLPTEAVEVAIDIAKIQNPGTRKQVADAIRILLAKYFE